MEKFIELLSQYLGKLVVASVVLQQPATVTGSWRGILEQNSNKSSYFVKMAKTGVFFEVKAINDVDVIEGRLHIILCGSV